MHWAWATAAGGLTILIVWAALGIEEEVMWLPAAATLAPLLVLYLARHRFQPAFVSPVWIAVIVLSGTGTAGYALAADLAGMAGGGILLTLPQELIPSTALIFATSALSLTAGALLVAVAAPASRPRVRLSGIAVTDGTRTVLLLLSLLPLILIAFTIGEDIFDRSTYLTGGASQAVYGLAQQLSIAAVALTGYVAAGSRGVSRAASISIAASYAAMFFALGTRRLALLPLVFAIGYLLAKPRRFVPVLLAASCVAVILLPLPLHVRAAETHGLLPYIASLSTYSLASVEWLSVANNVLIAFPITGMSALYVAPIPLGYLFVSLNPLPGDSAGWYAVAGELRLNLFTPYSAVGELWNYGPWIAVAVWAIFGIALAVLDRAIGKLWLARSPLFALGIIGLTALFAVFTIQYNLRSSSRLLLYGLIVAALGAIFAARKADEREPATAAEHQVTGSPDNWWRQGKRPRAARSMRSSR